MEALTQANLLNMYVDWVKRYGNKRNEKDIRFGQWIWIHFADQLQEIKSSIPEPQSYLDGFYTESPETAYNQILKMINNEY